RRRRRFFYQNLRCSSCGEIISNSNNQQQGKTKLASSGSRRREVRTVTTANGFNGTLGLGCSSLLSPERDKNIIELAEQAWKARRLREGWRGVIMLTSSD